MITALVFDLDDTLYREINFIESGYRAVARHVADNLNCNFETLFSTMNDTFNTSGCQKVMSMVRERLSGDSMPIDELVTIYRQHRPIIQLYPGYYDLLQNLSRQYRLGIIMDGMPDVQERKAHALRLEEVVENIIYTWELGEEKQKPHPHSFILMLKFLQTDSRNVLFIGDNPSKDCIGAHNVGMKYAQIRYPVKRENDHENSCEKDPEYIIDTLFQLPTILQELK
jgi:putative hydrolase of the HAD superfamily